MTARLEALALVGSLLASSLVSAQTAPQVPGLGGYRRRALTAAGHEVEEAVDGRAVLDLHRAKRYDLLVLDLYMPGTDGLEATIRLIQECPKVRIVAISGGGYRHKTDVLLMALNAGARRTVAKPFTVEKLVGAVSEVLKEAPE